MVSSKPNMIFIFWTAAPEAPARMEPEGPPEYTAADITRELEDGASSFPGLVNEVQRRLGKILSTSDLKSLYTLYDYLALPAEVICLLVSWCVEEFQRKYGPGRKPRMSQIRKEAFVWRRLGVDTDQAADAYIKRQAELRKHFGTVKAIREADETALAAVLPQNVAHTLWIRLHEKEST